MLTRSFYQVPTILVYPTNESKPCSWGFLSETDTERQAENKEYQECFKTYLDEERLLEVQTMAKDKSDVPRSIELVEKWYGHETSGFRNEISV